MGVIRSTTGRRRRELGEVGKADLPDRIHAKCTCGQLLGTLHRARWEDGTPIWDNPCTDEESWFEYSKATGVARYPGEELYHFRLVSHAKPSISEDLIFKVTRTGWPDGRFPARRKWAFDCPNHRCRAHHSVQPMTMSRLVVEAHARGQRHIVVP